MISWRNKKNSLNLPTRNKKRLYVSVLLSHGVTGNTSVFGTEESRFEPWWDNSKGVRKLAPFFVGHGFVVVLLFKAQPKGVQNVVQVKLCSVMMLV